MASAAFQKTRIFIGNPIQNPSRNRSQNGIPFQTLFIRISGDFFGKRNLKMGSYFRKNPSKNKIDFRARFGKGLGRDGKRKVSRWTFCAGGARGLPDHWGRTSP